MKIDKNGKFIIRGAAVLAVGAFTAKLIGALYRVPLTNLLGGEGLGLYQMIFPAYTLLLDFSGAGVPSALSKIISGYKGENKEVFATATLKGALTLFSVFGLICSALMLIFSGTAAAFQGNANARIGYVFLSPSVFFVSIISCFRGYFQGNKKMIPTAVSQVAEQLVKFVSGIVFVKVFLPDVALAAGGAALAVTLSEIFAVIFLYTVFLIGVKRGKPPLKTSTVDRFRIKEIIKTAVPVTVVNIAVPISLIIDGFLVINLLSRYTSEATGLYGLYSGAANTVIGLPVAICYALAAVAIPAVSGAKNRVSATKSGRKTLLLTALVSLPAGLIAYFFAPQIVRILFSRLSADENSITVNLVKTLSFNVVALSMLQTENAVLIGKGRTYAPLIGMGVGLVLKTVLNVLLMSVPTLNIFGAAISSIACYFSAGLINLILSLTLNAKVGLKNGIKENITGENTT